jgi:hypothetical protein
LPTSDEVARRTDGLWGIDNSSQDVRAASADPADQQTSDEPDCRAERPEKQLATYGGQNADKNHLPESNRFHDFTPS